MPADRPGEPRCAPVAHDGVRRAALLPAAVAADLVDVHLARLSTRGEGVYRALLLLAAAGAGALALVEVQVSVRGEGVVRSATPAEAAPGLPLVAEVRVAAADAAALRVGGPVRFRVAAPGADGWGTLAGRVAAIEDDVLADGRPVVRVRCTLAAPGPRGAHGRLRRGTILRARFPVARRPVLALLAGRAGASGGARGVAGPA